MRPAIVTIYFGGQHLEKVYKRIEVYSYSNILAICGGLLGLFMGVSVISIIEFIYYSTLRLYWAIRKGNFQTTVAPFKKEPINDGFSNMPNA